MIDPPHDPRATTGAADADGIVEPDGPLELPSQTTLVRTTREFDERTVPDGLLAAHRVADGVWGRLVVVAGSLRFGFEDDAVERTLVAGRSQVIPPGRLHHVALDGPVRFVVEFHRPSGVDTVSS